MNDDVKTDYQRAIAALTERAEKADADLARLTEALRTAHRALTQRSAAPVADWTEAEGILRAALSVHDAGAKGDAQ